MMNMSISRKMLENYVLRLVATHIPDDHELEYEIGVFISKALERIEFCFSNIKRKYYHNDEKVLFNHLNSDHMAVFLYFLSNTIWEEINEDDFPTRLFYLNKILHGIDLFYSVRMPDIFLFVHPVGTVLGNASYSDYLVVYQNCTVGALDVSYPRFGNGTILYSRSSVLGDCEVEDNVVFAANSMIVNVNVPANTLVLGQYPNQRYTSNSRTVYERCFDFQV
jgi:serine O-acetyltransferase